MAPTTRAAARWAISRAVALPELWALVAENSGLVGAWRLTGVYVAAREGAKVWLRTLPGLVLCGGLGLEGAVTSAVWRLDLGELRWERMSDLVLGRAHHPCCAVRGGVAVLGGQRTRYNPGENEVEDCFNASVEILGYDSEAEEKVFRALRRWHAAPSAAPLRSSSSRARASRGKCSSSADTTDIRQLRRCTRLTWRLGSALLFLLSFLPGDCFAWLRGCQTGASFAWVRTFAVIQRA
jgi:hypothetical protein